MPTSSKIDADSQKVKESKIESKETSPQLEINVKEEILEDAKPKIDKAEQKLKDTTMPDTANIKKVVSTPAEKKAEAIKTPVAVKNAPGIAASPVKAAAVETQKAVKPTPKPKATPKKGTAGVKISAISAAEKKKKQIEKSAPVEKKKTEFESGFQKTKMATKKPLPPKEVPTTPIKSAVLTKGVTKFTGATISAEKSAEKTPVKTTVMGKGDWKETWQEREKDRAAAREQADVKPQSKTQKEPQSKVAEQSKVVKESKAATKSKVGRGVADLPGTAATISKDRTHEVKAGTERVVGKVMNSAGKAFKSIKDRGGKTSRAISESLKFSGMKKSIVGSMSAMKHPVKTVSNLDKAVTAQMRKLTLLGNKNSNISAFVDAIKSKDRSFTRSEKGMVDSVMK